MDQTFNTFQNQNHSPTYNHPSAESTPPIMLHKHMLSTQKFQEAVAGSDGVSQVSGAVRGRFKFQQPADSG